MKKLRLLIPLLLMLALSSTAYADTAATGSIAALNGAVTVTTVGMSTLTFQISGTYAAVVTPQLTNDGVTWVTATVTGPYPSTSTATTITNGTGVWSITVAGWQAFRLIATAYTSGTAAVWEEGSPGSSASGGGGGGGGGGGSVTQGSPPWTINWLDVAPATSTITAADVASSTATGANSQSIITGTPTAGSFVAFALGSQAIANIQVTGTWVGTLQTEVSLDAGTTWYIRGIHLFGTNYNSSAFTANFGGEALVSGATNIRIRCTSYTSGTATVKVTESLNPGVLYLANSPQIADGTTPSQKLAINASGQAAIQPLPAGSAVIGHVIADSGSTTAVTALPAIPAGTNVIGHVIADSGSTTAVTGNVAITAAALPLPAGAATSALQPGFGTAGTPSANVGSIQGVAGGTAVPISGTVSGSGNFTNGSIGATGATAPTSATLSGGVYNSSLPTYVTGQLTQLQTDANGRLIVYDGTLRAGEDTTNNVAQVVPAVVIGTTYSFSVDAAFGTLATHAAKTSGGQLMSFTCSNVNAALRWFQVFNSTGATTGTPVFSFPVPAGSATVPGVATYSETFFGTNGAAFATGITWGFSTTQATYTAGTAADCNVNLIYK